MLKDKILAKLVALYPGLSKEVLGLIATQIATKVTEESGIDQAITDYDNAASIKTLAEEFQKEGDRRVSTAQKEWEKKNPTKKPGKTDKPEENKEDETAVLLKTLLEEVKTLKADKAQSSIRDKIKEKLKDAKIPEKFYAKWALPEKEEEVDAFVESITSDYTSFKQEMINQGLMQETPPENGSGGSSNKREASKEEVDAVVKDIM